MNVNGVHIAGYMTLDAGAALEYPFYREESAVGDVQASVVTIDRPELRAAGGASRRLESCGSGIPQMRSDYGAMIRHNQRLCSVPFIAYCPVPARTWFVRLLAWLGLSL